jgi:hypothetical protein
MLPPKKNIFQHKAILIVSGPKTILMDKLMMVNWMIEYSQLPPQIASTIILFLRKISLPACADATGS